MCLSWGSRPTCLSVCLSIYLSIYLCICQSNYQHACMHVGMYGCVCVRVCCISRFRPLPILSFSPGLCGRSTLASFVHVLPSSPPPLLFLLFCLAPWRSQLTVSSIHFIPFTRTRKQRARAHTHTYTCTHVFCGCELAFDRALYRPCQEPCSMPQSLPPCFRPRLPLSLCSLILPDYFCSLSP